MAENVPTSGFNVPPTPGAPAPQNPAPAPAPAAPAAPAQGYTQADIDKAVAAALAGRQPAPAQAPAPQAPAAPVNPAAAINLSEEAEADPLLNSLTSTFSNIGNGVDINRAIGTALQLGRPDLIDVAYLTEKGGANAATLVSLAQSIVGRVQEQTRSAEAAVHSAAGSKENWEAAAGVFNQKAPQHLKVVVAKLLESGNPDSIKAGAQMAIDYARSQGLVPQAAGLVQAGGGVAGAQGLGKLAFQDALFKLDRNSRTFEQDRADLFARRAVGKQLGLN